MLHLAARGAHPRLPRDPDFAATLYGIVCKLFAKWGRAKDADSYEDHSYYYS